MSNTKSTAPSEADPDAVRADLERTRSELADTVDQLSEKLNVKAQVSEKVSTAKGRATETAARAKASAPPPVRQALDKAGQRVSPIAHQVSEQAAPHRKQMLAGLVATCVALLVARRRRARSKTR
ncbi:MAG: hypothetical protein QOE58_2069 [Actinomycetota bacterium]|nr:hypothetical protein [Actinomycetota bacterium]